MDGIGWLSVCGVRYRAYSANKVSTEVSYPDDLDVQLIVRWKESSVDSPIARESGKE